MEPSGADEIYVPLLARLEGSPGESNLSAAEAAGLVEYALRHGSEWWASHAIDWVDQGACNDAVAVALRAVTVDKRFSQRLRHRAKSAAKRWNSQRPAPPAPGLSDIEATYRDLISQRTTRESADEWAMQWVGASESGIGDPEIWTALLLLAGIDERDAPDGDYLTSREQIGEALADFAKRDS
ncbi:MAG: hypothetical protein WA988_16550 [Candidatus Nanopelagicales bacterium]